MNHAKTKNPYILKGGTALRACYGLDRFSEDIDLDAPRKTTSPRHFFSVVNQFCKKYKYTFRKAKDTATVGRVFINYGSEKPLKIEVSYREETIDSQAITIKYGFQVYTIPYLAVLKAYAYRPRDKIRNLYDISFICTHYFHDLPYWAQETLKLALQYKDLDQFDYLIHTQFDPLIDINKLETEFLKAFKIARLLKPERVETENRASLKEKCKESEMASNEIRDMTSKNKQKPLQR